MAYFPFFVDISRKKCCVIGGGIIALRKVEALLEFEADITLIAPRICEELLQYHNRITLIRKKYQESDLEGAFYVIAATDDSEVNQSIAQACEERKLLVNVVDDKDKCNFIFPSYLKLGDITIGVTTSGKSPVMAGHIRREIEQILPDYYGTIVARLGELREYVKEEISQYELRANVMEKLIEAAIANHGELTDDHVKEIIRCHQQ